VPTRARAEPQRGYGVLDREIELTRPESAHGALGPAAREARVEHYGMINQSRHCSDALAKVGQRDGRIRARSESSPASCHGGRIDVDRGPSSLPMRVTAKAINGHFAVSVADTGPGILEHEQSRIFEKLHQIDSSNIKVKAVLVLALPSLTDRGDAWWAHLGRICDRQGLNLPDGASHARRNAEDCPMSKRILVVEDQEDLRGVLRTLLSGSGYIVIEAADGEAGVSKALAERPDLILMDIQLPVLNGYDATRRIKADPNLKDTPVIAVSSFAMKGDEEKARVAGCDHYVTKPYSPMQLLRIIRGFLAEKT
jgi:two-component system cell cycle response regulator DivK